MIIVAVLLMAITCTFGCTTEYSELKFIDDEMSIKAKGPVFLGITPNGITALFHCMLDIDKNLSVKRTWAVEPKYLYTSDLQGRLFLVTPKRNITYYEDLVVRCGFMRRNISYMYTKGKVNL